MNQKLEFLKTYFNFTNDAMVKSESEINPAKKKDKIAMQFNRMMTSMNDL